MQKYFISNSQNYASKNSLQKQGSEALRWLDKILVDDLPKLHATIEGNITMLNSHNTRCKPLVVEFRYPKEGGIGYCGIKEQYMFYIYPVAKDFTDELNLEKAKKWDLLDDMIGKCYFDEDGNELSEDESQEIDLSTIGEIAANQFGYL
jgi:hypothetical protein